MPQPFLLHSLFFQLSEAADATYEIDAFVCALVFDTEDGIQEIIGKNGYVQHTDRIFGEGAGPGVELVPLIAEIHAKFMEMGRRKCLINFFDRESSFQFFEEVCFTEPIEVFHYTVVIHYVQLVGGKERGEKDIGAWFCCCAKGFAHFRGGSGAVVAICNVCSGHQFQEQIGNGTDGIIIIDGPDGMADAIICREEVSGVIGGLPFFNEFVQLRNIAVSEEYITGLCTGGFDMIDAVLFFFRAGELMFFDEVLFIIINGAAAYESSLAASIHDELINIVAGFFFAEEGAAADEVLQVFFRLIINGLRMYVNVIRQIDFGFGDMQKGVGGVRWLQSWLPGY